LGLGSLLALVCREPGLLARLRPWAITGTLAVVPLIGAVCALERAAHIDYEGTHGIPCGPFARSVLSSVMGLCATGTVAWCLAARPDEWISRILASRFEQLIARHSYAFFLLHISVRAVVRDAFYGPATNGTHPLIPFPTVMGSMVPAQLVFYAVAFVPCLAAAWASWHVYEKHWLGVKRVVLTAHGPRVVLEPVLESSKLESPPPTYGGAPWLGRALTRAHTPLPRVGRRPDRLANPVAFKPKL
jgi:peptidoglycan/LPS O-acetylase OafA/YrhL